MTRKLRVEYFGAICPVINRGERRESIFRDHADRQRFVETLPEVGAFQDALLKGPVDPSAGRDEYS